MASEELVTNPTQSVDDTVGSPNRCIVLIMSRTDLKLELFSFQTKFKGQVVRYKIGTLVNNYDILILFIEFL